MKKKKRVFLISLGVVAVCICLFVLAAANFLKSYGDSLMYRWDDDTVKVRLVNRIQDYLADLREHPPIKPLGVLTSTLDILLPDACSVLLSDALTRNSASPEVSVVGYANGADGKLWVSIAVRFSDDTNFIIHTYQEGITGCERATSKTN